MEKTAAAPSYKQQPITGRYDAIVIGSGLGGMATAAYLSKVGKRVLVLERHYTPGGFTHTFARRGYEWDVGVHYVGEVHRPRSQVSQMFRAITDGKLLWAEMDEVYDKLFFGDDVYELPRGKDAFAARMKRYFPAAEDQRAIDEYLRLVYETQRTLRLFFLEKVLPPRWTGWLGDLMRKKALAWNRPTLEVLRGLTTNPRLIGVLTGQYGDYGLTPSKSSFLMHAMLVKHFMNGGNYPVGGAAQIFAHIAPVVRAADGEIYTNADVAEIIVRDGRALGVKMADGRELLAPLVISDAGVSNTYRRLLPESERARLGVERLLAPLTPSVGHLCLYVGINRPNSELGLGKANYWIYPDSYDHDTNLQRYMLDPASELPVIYVSFPSSKDPDWERRYPGRTTLEIITLAPFDWYRSWKDEKWMRRGEDYEAKKEAMTERLLEALYRRHPELRGKIDYTELSTPLSTRHFANYDFGELYGIDHDPVRYAQRFLRPHTPVRNLYLTGQDVTSCGIGGALVSGLLTAVAITKKNLAKSPD